MPGVVGNGRKPKTFACGYCHYPNGQGRPENSSLAGLSAGYIAQQIADYKNNLRKTSEPKMVPPLAGRSPTYTVRQLYDFQSGARAGLLVR